MLFNSYIFIFFYLPVTLAGYFLLNRLRLGLASNAWLLFASLFFYAWWDVRYLPLILGSILFNYTIGGLLTDYDSLPKKFFRKGALLAFGLAANLLFLGWFKYTDFLIGNVNAIAGTNLQLLRIVLPLGISFFTITQIAFLVDAYEGLVEERKLLNYALFVTFFPHLLAGPILHHKEMMPQFDRPRNKVIDYRNVAAGLFLFFVGLFKKAVIADQFVDPVRNGFDVAASLNFFEAWTTALSYTLQLYFDFSGYSDMAVGIGLLFNIRLPVNFDSPYKATSIIEFWKRWHITLTNFITTYVYTPILRSFGKITFGRSLLAIFLAMFISGIWHGAGWTFVLWGSLHGTALVTNHWWKRRKLKMPAPAAWGLTFLFVTVSFVFFRARTMADALKVLNGMTGRGGLFPHSLLESFTFGSIFDSRFGKTLLAGINGRTETIWMAAGALLLVLELKSSSRMAEEFEPGRCALVLTLGSAIYALLNMGKVSEFLYFQF
jgi:alginate O-acetyltransferase complex protein AlgI